MELQYGDQKIKYDTTDRIAFYLPNDINPYIIFEWIIQFTNSVLDNTREIIEFQMESLTSCIAIFWQASNVISKVQFLTIMQNYKIEIEGKSDNWDFSPAIVYGQNESKLRKYKTISAWSISLLKNSPKTEKFDLSELTLIDTYISKLELFLKDVYENYKLETFLSMIDLLDYITGQWPFTLDKVCDWVIQLIDKILSENASDHQKCSQAIIGMIRVLSRAVIYKSDAFFTEANLNILIRILDYIPEDSKYQEYVCVGIYSYRIGTILMNQVGASFIDIFSGMSISENHGCSGIGAMGGKGLAYIPVIFSILSKVLHLMARTQRVVTDLTKENMKLLLMNDTLVDSGEFLLFDVSLSMTNNQISSNSLYLTFDLREAIKPLVKHALEHSLISRDHEIFTQIID